MNVIPFPAQKRPSPVFEPLAFAIGARVDLRVGALASGVVRARAPLNEAFSFTGLSRLLRGARMAWRERCAMAPLTLSVPAEITSNLEAELLSEAAIESGCTRRGFGFELDEIGLAASNSNLGEELRARGWSVTLRGHPDCPLPLGARARALYDELVLDAPDQPGPFLSLEDADASPLSRRLAAAKAAGLVITADCVRSAHQARTLAMVGFDRGGGPFAEAGLR